MNWRREVSRIAALFRRRKLADEIDEEVRIHLEMEEQENRERGMTPEEAHYAALRRFGNVTQAQETSREMWAWQWLETLLQDVRLALRQLRRNPGFTAVAIITLALGIGANTAIFSIFDDTMLRPLPYPAADRLVALNEAKLTQPSDNRWEVSLYTFMDWKERSKSFEALSLIHWHWAHILEGPNGAQILKGRRVTDGYFKILAGKTSLGRLFLPDDYAQNAEPVVVLSAAAWRQYFSSDPNVTGKEVKLSGKFFTVVGVLSPDFHTLFGDHPDIWVPITWRSHNRKGRYFDVIGRLKKGVGVQTAQAEMDVIARRIAKDDPDAAGFGASVKPIQEWMYGRFVKSQLLPMFGAVLFVLLIACANVASLMLARATARDKEFAIRCAVGGGRTRLIRQLLTESTLLAAVGGGLGMLLAYMGLTLMARLAPDVIPEAAAISVNFRILGFTFLVALLTGLLFGLLPALVASKPNLNESLKETGRRVKPGIAGRGAHGVLVVAEVALALILLIGAGLMIHNIWHLQRLDVGFNPRNLIAMTVTLPEVSCCVNTPKQKTLKPWAVRARKQIRERLQALPGIKTVSTADRAPLWGCSTRIIGIGGQPPPDLYKVRMENPPVSCFQPVTPDYFRTLQVPLLKGRALTEQDNPGSPRVALVNEAFARRYFPSEDPLGKVVRLGYWDKPDEDPPRQIVGVVRDFRQMLHVKPIPALFVPYSQLRPAFQGPQTMERTRIVYVARTLVDPNSLVSAMRRIESKVAPQVPVEELTTVDELRQKTIRGANLGFYEWLLIVFAGIAVVLTVVGVFGVVSYSVSRRTHEIGIRMALGAKRSDVLKMVAWRGLKLALIGVAIGIGGAFGLTRFLSSLLYGVKPTDPVTFVAVSLILIVVALVACYIPARRAAKVDPMVALRYE